MSRRSRGLSLLELLIVISLLVAVGALSLTGFGGFSRRTRGADALAQVLADHFRQARAQGARVLSEPHDESDEFGTVRLATIAAYEGARVVCEVLQRPKGLQAFRILSMDDSTAVHPAQLPPARTHVTVNPTSGLERAQVK